MNSGNKNQAQNDVLNLSFVSVAKVYIYIIKHHKRLDFCFCDIYFVFGGGRM